MYKNPDTPKIHAEMCKGVTLLSKWAMSKLVSAGPVTQNSKTQTWKIDLKFMTGLRFHN